MTGEQRLLQGAALLRTAARIGAFQDISEKKALEEKACAWPCA